MSNTNERLVTDEPSPDETAQVLKAFFRGQSERRAEQRKEAENASGAIKRLAIAMQERTDQSYTLRALLYSLWNGHPASLLEVATLDWPLRRDLCQVIAAFGFEEPKGVTFYYDAIKATMVQSGQFDWFIAAREESGVAV